MNRREFITRFGLSALTLSSTSSFAASSGLILPKEEHRTLKIKNLHTGDSVNATYWEHGEYLIDGLAELYFAMRDHRANLVTAMDIDLLDTLHGIQSQFDNHQEIYLLSGYRSPKTNESLRKQQEGVAKHSLHMQGRALDFRMPGVSNRYLNQASLSISNGGVGYYRNSGFIHLDTGRKRHWVR